ncbi:MAG: tetratricopeptide repeat protein [Candidatus Acidiferrales bacterium]
MSVLRGISLLIVLALACASAGARMQSVPSPAKPPAPTYNPMRAVHDVDVGKFYMKRGDLDGAIARFKDAMRYKPNYAEPCLLLGQVYEQKHDAASAISYYQQYLKILPGGSESRKVRKRIGDLQEKTKKNETSNGQGNR